MRAQKHTRKTAQQSFSERLRKQFKKEPVAGGSLVVSILALVIASAGQVISYYSYSQTVEQYVDERAIVLAAQFGQGTDSLVVRPTDAMFHFVGVGIARQRV